MEVIATLVCSLCDETWKRVFNQNRRRFPFPEGVKWVKIFMVLLIIQVSLLDPLFFFIPVIDEHQNCVRLDKKLGTALMVFRSLIDSFYVIYIIVELQKHFLVVRPTGRKNQYIRLGKFFLIDFLAVLPLPQVVILKLIPAMRGRSRFLNAMYLLRSVVLCQFVPRSFRAYRFITSGTFGVPAKATFKFSPLIYLFGIDVIGAFWYFLSIERLVQCWAKVCNFNGGCVGSFYCKDYIEDPTSRPQIDALCPRDGDTDWFDFGIFKDALRHGVLEMTYFPKKFLYCFQWSVQSLSAFGGYLDTSNYIWESVFVISITILGLLLFFLLLEKLQTYMQSQRKESKRMEESEKKKLKAIESIQNWPPLKKLSVNLRQDIKRHLKYNWENSTTEPGIILHELPTDLKRRIEREHGSELLEKVKAFKAIDKKLLDDLSNSIELKLFDKSEYIMKEGKTINGMVFIFHGELEARNSFKDYLLTDGDICGEEVTWDIVFNDLWSSFELRGSTLTVKVRRRVHALVLPVNKVRDFFHHLPDDLKRSARHELCFDFLEKVNAFKHIGKNELDDLSRSIQLKLFDNGEYIVEEGKTINDMVFILNGKLVARNTLDCIAQMNVLKDGDICGEEVTWEVFYHDRWPSSWRSTVTIKALTRVHALVLPVDKVRDFLHCLPDDLQMSVRRELYFVFFKKVKVFKHIGQNELDDLSESIQLKQFDGGEYIVEEGKTINDIVFIVHGKLEARNSLTDYLLIDGDICGVEATWDIVFNDMWSSFELRESTMTVKVLRRVHALVLPVNKVRDFFNRLPDDLKRSVRHELCFDFLEKVNAFKHIGQNELDDLFGSIQLKLFNDGEYILEEGKTINDMVFILSGKLVTRSTLDCIAPMNVLKDGDICGEEVTWEVIFLDQWPSLELWRSTVTIKALMRVHALVLPADKVRDFLRRLPDDLRMSIRRELCFVFLKKVKVFKLIGQNELDDLSESIQLKLFDEGEYIVEEGNTINDIVFIVHGKLEARNSLRDYLLIDGDICGEEVTGNGFRGDWSSDQLPLSTMTIKAVTRVHALILPIQRVRDFLHREDLQRSIRLELQN